MSLDRDGNSFRTDVPGNPPDPASYYERLYGEARAAITLRAENVVLRKMEANLQTRVASLEDENARLKARVLELEVASRKPTAKDKRSASNEAVSAGPSDPGVAADGGIQGVAATNPSPSSSASGARPVEIIPSVTRAEFLADAAAVLRLSERFGVPVAIMHRGKPCAIVSAAVGPKTGKRKGRKSK